MAGTPAVRQPTSQAVTLLLLLAASCSAHAAGGATAARRPAAQLAVSDVGIASDATRLPRGRSLEGADATPFVGSAMPTFGWTVQCAPGTHEDAAAAVACRGMRQTAARIQIRDASSAAIVMDTGRVQTLEPTMQPDVAAYTTPLRSGWAYEVRVSVWGAESESTSPSRWVRFHTAVLAAADWGAAQWIGGHTQLRGGFDLPAGTITSASLFASAAGCYSITVNGVDPSGATASMLDPGFSTVPTERMLYRAYDVTKLLTPGGSNAVGARLGMCKYGYLGAYCSGASASGDSATCKAFIAHVAVTFAGGATFNFSTTAPDAAWVGSNVANPVRYAHLYHGEIFDGRIEAKYAGWDSPGYKPDPAVFAPAVPFASPDTLFGALTLHDMPPIGLDAVVPAVAVHRIPAAPGFCPATVLGGAAMEGDALTLTCASASETITGIDFAAFGNPQSAAGRFIKASGPDIYWQSYDNTTSLPRAEAYVAASGGTKHHVATCTPCPNTDACNLFETVTDAELNGLPTGAAFNCSQMGSCAAISAGSCSAHSSLSTVQNLCVGKSSCTVTASVATFGGTDPCPSLAGHRRLVVRAHGCAPAALGDAFVFDFGDNMGGVVSLNATAVAAVTGAGAQIVLRHGEQVNPDGSVLNGYCGWPCSCPGGNCANMTDLYVTAGGGASTDGEWHSRHTYKGFRYVQVQGLPPGFTPDTSMLSARFTHSLVPHTGHVHFTNTSLAILNEIQAAVQQTQLSNLHSIPTDCPTREKRGWMGDAQVSSPEAALNFDMRSLYANFLRTMGDTQAVGCAEPANAALVGLQEIGVAAGAVATEAAPRPPTYQCCDHAHPSFGCSWTGTNFSGPLPGALPDVVPYTLKPYGGWPGDPSWALAGSYIPWEVLNRTGDSAFATATYAVAKGITDFHTRHVDPSNGLVQFGYYGDWLQLCTTPNGQVTSFSHLHAVAHMADLARATGNTKDAAQYDTLLAQLRRNYHAAYWDATTKSYGACQTANAIAVVARSAPTQDRAALGAALAASVTGANPAYTVTVGLVGSRYLLEALSLAGYGDVAVALAAQTIEPSWGNMLRVGPGTIWESWSGGGSSRDHPMFAGGIGSWFYEVAGLSLASVSSHGDVGVRFRPDVAAASVLGGANASIATPWGPASAVWSSAHLPRASSPVFSVNLTVPVNAPPVHVHLPVELARRLRHTQRPFVSAALAAGKWQVVDTLSGCAVRVVGADGRASSGSRLGECTPMWHGALSAHAVACTSTRGEEAACLQAGGTGGAMSGYTGVELMLAAGRYALEVRVGIEQHEY